MADKIPIFPKAGSILFHSGNIVTWNRLKRKPIQNTQDEVSECISGSLGAWLSDVDKNEAQYATQLECANTKFVEKLPEGERENLKVTVKVFLRRCDPSLVEEAVQKACEALGDLSFLESVLVSFPEDLEEPLKLEDIQPVWEKLEQMVEEEKVRTLGVSDLNLQQLEELYNWAKNKPTTNQVNLESCCVMPAEMTEFAKEHDIQLLTHNDPREVITRQSFQTLISDATTQRDAANWDMSWILRYSVVVKCRGIIKAKGYMCKAVRDIKKRP